MFARELVGSEIRDFADAAIRGGNDIKVASSLWQDAAGRHEPRKPIVDGLLREGETMTIVANPNSGKSWMALDLALAVATAGRWLESFACESGSVLVIDTELHAETSVNRLSQVAMAKSIDIAEIANRIHVANLRGNSQSIFALRHLLESLKPKSYNAIVIDALSSYMIIDTCHSTGPPSNVFNILNHLALQLGCAFVLVQHANQASDPGQLAIDIVGGAGNQSLAADTHVVLRPHAQDNAIVLEAATRSWPPPRPRCFRWNHPVWQPADSFDPAKPRTAKSRKRAATRRNN